MVSSNGDEMDFHETKVHVCHPFLTAASAIFSASSSSAILLDNCFAVRAGKSTSASPLEDFFIYSTEGLVTGQDALDFPQHVRPWVASTSAWRDVKFTQIYTTMPPALRKARAEGNANRQLALAIRAEVKVGRVERAGKGDVYRAHC